MEIVVTDANLDRVVGILSEAARTGKIGDGKIFVSTIDNAIRIRNGDKGRRGAVICGRKLVSPSFQDCKTRYSLCYETAPCSVETRTAQVLEKPFTPATKVVVATTVALSFISFWRGAAIVLSDLASSAFYAGGIAEQAIGKSAPWFILGVMLFSFAVRSVYMEGCSMFVRGGVYVVVRDAMGPFMARLSVSALIFDYILTGPISSVSAGQYLGRLLNEIAEMTHSSLRIPPNLFAAVFGVVVTAYFWRSNIKGIHESSGKALRIMQITTVMVVIFLIWCPLTILLRGPAQIPPAPVLANLHFSDEGLGWFKGTVWPSMAFAAIIIAFGHSLLSMSGFETLAQVYREIAYPKLKNLRITANMVCYLRRGLHRRRDAVRRLHHSRRDPRQLHREPAGRPCHASGRTRDRCA